MVFNIRSIYEQVLTDSLFYDQFEGAYRFSNFCLVRKTIPAEGTIITKAPP